MILSTLSGNVLNLALLPVLLLVLLHVLHILRPPVQPPISAGIIANTGTGSTLQSSMHMGSGKLTDRQGVHTLPAGGSNLGFLQDSLSGRIFLVDTGAFVSVFPKIAPTPSAPLSNTKLLTTSGSPLP